MGKSATAFLAVLAISFSLQTAGPAVADPTESAEQTIDRVNQILVKGQKPSEKDCETLGEIVASQPNNTKAHLTLGLAYESMGLPQQSQEQYKLAVQLSPDDPRPLADLLRQRINTNQLGESAQLALMAVRKFPNDAEILFYSGYIELENREMAGADTLLNRAYHLNPKIPLLKSSLAEVKLDQRNYDQAYVLAQDELRVNPHVARANMVAGLALLHLKRYDQAVNFLGKASLAMPSHSDLTEKLAQLAVWTGRYDDAIGPICLFLAHRTNVAADQKKMCTLLVDCLRHTPKDKALTTINEISQKYEPAARNGYFHNAVGEALAERGWNESATNQFKEAVKLVPSSGRINFNLGKEYEFYLHDYVKALEYYKKAEVSSDVAMTDATDYVNRLEDRLARSQSDVASRLRDWLTAPHQQ